MRKVCVLSLELVFCIALVSAVYAADEAATKTAPVVRAATGAAASPAQAAGRSAAAMRPMSRPAMSMLFGTVTNIDTKDPAVARLDIQTEADNKTHTVEVPAAATVTKVTDLSELKKGDKVRIMARSADGKEIAMGVMFGNIKSMPAPRPMPSGMPQAMPQRPEAQAKETPKK